MFTCRTPVFQFHINRRSSNLSLLHVTMPRKSPHISCLLFPRDGYWAASKRRTPSLAERACGWPVDNARTSTLHDKKKAIVSIYACV
jgi:hypothetical protein